MVSIAIWIKHFVKNLKLGISDKLDCVFCDNKSAISLMKSGANSYKGKYIDINYQHMQDKVKRGEIKVDYIASSEMVANLMTNGLSLEKFRGHVIAMGLRTA